NPSASGPAPGSTGTWTPSCSKRLTFIAPTMVSWGGHGYPPHDPRPLSPRRRRPSHPAAPLIASGEACAGTGAEPEGTKSSSLDEVHGGLRPSPRARERRRRSERTWVLEHRSAAPLPRGWAKPKPEIGGRPGPLRFRRCPTTLGHSAPADAAQSTGRFAI